MEDIPQLSCSSLELSILEEKEGSSDQVEQTSMSNNTKVITIDIQEESDLMHVSVIQWLV
jgi:hypothetical protein